MIAECGIRIAEFSRGSAVGLALKFKRSVMFISRYLPEKFYLENDQRVDLRDKIFREVISNAIVHRKYTSALSTDLIIYENEVCITNPNRALFHGSIDPFSFNPFPKNPNIRKYGARAKSIIATIT